MGRPGELLRPVRRLSQAVDGLSERRMLRRMPAGSVPVTMAPIMMPFARAAQIRQILGGTLR